MKTRKKKLLKSYIFIFLFLVLLIFLSSKTIGLFLKYRELDARYQQDLTKIESEEKKKEVLEKDLEFLGTKKGQERILVEKSNLKRPGEHVIKILDY